MPVNDQEYAVLKNRSDKYEAARKELFPNTNAFTPEMIASIVKHAGIDRAPDNTERSQIETYEFIVNPPESYFLYINREKRTATTWTGEVLGVVTFGNEWRDNFGGKRVPVTVTAINGKTYHGTYFKSSGDYARIKQSKARRKAA
jgi:hypothetical protein